MMTNRHALWAVAAGAAWLCAGCSQGLTLSDDPSRYVKPTVAVMNFENRAPFPVGWKIGDGMRDVLTDRLVATGRFHVIERPELGAVVEELKLQHSGLTRQQNRSSVGRLKNCNYLVKGTITDFGHVSTRRGAMWWDMLGVFGGTNRAVIGMTLYVVDVESGQIIASESLEESVRAGDLSVQAQYRNVGFGGTVFYRTPLGRATARVIDRAVRSVTRSIAARPWEPRIALVQPPATVVINGGADRRVRQGASFEVYQLGSPIIDPDTGDVIGHQPGKTVGRLLVKEVRPRYSVAGIMQGRVDDFQQGQRCRAVREE